MTPNNLNWITNYIWGIAERTLGEICGNILTLEQETEGLLGEIIG